MQDGVETTAPGWGCTILVSSPRLKKPKGATSCSPRYQHGADGEPHAAMCGDFLLLLTWQYEATLSTATFIWIPFQILRVSRAP